MEGTCTIGTSDFDAQMSGIKIYKGDEILRPVYIQLFSEMLSSCLHIWTFYFIKHIEPTMR